MMGNVRRYSICGGRFVAHRHGEYVRYEDFSPMRFFERDNAACRKKIQNCQLSLQCAIAELKSAAHYFNTRGDKVCGSMLRNSRRRIERYLRKCR